jgi:DNA repair exonuclease SbcCD ATPase subunit
MNNIIFKKLTFKNFMSYKDEQTVNFNSGMHLVTGPNGTGKTSQFIALYYVLYGKPYKKNKLVSLINNIINKDMLVTIDFYINDDQYNIKRGQKPAIFEIYKNDILINQSATTAEYQRILEEDILKISDNVFKQLIFLGANISTSKSFVDLTKAEKEELFQVITDTSIFNELKDLIKIKVKEYTQELSDTNFKISVLKESIINDTKSFEQLELQNVKILEHNQKLSEKKEYLTTIIDDINKTINKYNEGLQKVRDKKPKYDELKLELKVLEDKETYYTGSLLILDKKLQRILDVESSFGVCIGCDKLKIISNVDIIEKDNIVEEINNIKELTDKLEPRIEQISNELTELQNVFEKAKDIIQRRDIKLLDLNRYSNELLELKLLDIIDINYINLNDRKLQLDGLMLSVEKLTTLLQNYNQLTKLFDTNNIKGLIIKQALPLLNRYVNQYLDVFSDFPFKFNIDEQFVSGIKNINNINSPIDYEFASLSNGQSMRITFSLVLAFLKLIETKNGVTTNILILDEILDSSLDYNGRTELLSTIKETFYNKSVFVISHNDDVIGNELFNTQYRVINKQICKIEE